MINPLIRYLSPFLAFMNFICLIILLKLQVPVIYIYMCFLSFCVCRIGFVTQDDLLFPQLTVKETLIFAAQLRLPRTMTSLEKIMRAETVLKDLGLER